jgi:hypothetical protein
MLQNLRLVFSIVSLTALVGCGGGSATSPTAAPGAVPTPGSAPSPSATARYVVTFQSAWSRETHPTDFPVDPHFSPLVGGTHSARVGFWRAGLPASAGIEAMAERGRTSPLDTEIEAAVAQGTALQVLLGPSINPAPGSASIDFQIGVDRPLVTLVSMIAPSPDWFVGVHDLNLIEGGDWVAEKVVELFPYDAGTDDGPTYTSPDRDAQPRGTIHRLQRAPVTLGGSVAPFGTFVFRRVQ